MHYRLFFLIFLFVCGSSFTIHLDKANSDVELNYEAPKSIFERLSEQEILEMEVTTDISQLLDDQKEGAYQAAYLHFADPSISNVDWNIEIRTRGKFRKRVCSFPPVKFKFDHSVLGPENLKAYKTLKFVSHCADEDGLEELVLREYLAYKAFNLITDESFHVQLVKVKWNDSSHQHDIGEQWGFFIENNDEMSKRIGGENYKEYGVTTDELNPTSAALNSIFQYMIGNSDWNLEMIKNVKLVKSNSENDIKVVPYDFDFSGLVNAPYAVTSYGQTSVLERIYLGASSQQDIDAAVDIFRNKKNDIFSLVDSFEAMSKSDRKKIKKYLMSFYDTLHLPLKDKNYYLERIALIEGKSHSKT